MLTGIEKLAELFTGRSAISSMGVARDVKIPEMPFPSSGSELLFFFAPVDALKAARVAAHQGRVLAVLSMRRLAQVANPIVDPVSIPVVNLIWLGSKIHFPDYYVGTRIACADRNEDVALRYAARNFAFKLRVPNSLQMERRPPTRRWEMGQGPFPPIENALFSVISEALVQILLLWQIAGSLHVPLPDCRSEAMRSRHGTRRLVAYIQSQEALQWQLPA
jgi:hypothetical protein